MKDKKRGYYGYRKDMKIKQAAKVAVLAAFIVAQLVFRHFVEETTLKNIITVMAVMTVLPAANLASPLIAALPYRTVSKEVYDSIHPYEEKYTVLYDLILTTKDDVLPMDVIVVHPTGIYAWCTNQKADAAEAEKTLNETLSMHRLDPNMKITKEQYVFEKRMKSLKPASEYEDDGSVDYAVKLLKNLSM